MTFVLKQSFLRYVIFSVAICVFCGSVIAQIALHKIPCPLCLITRYLFLAIAICSLFMRRVRVMCPFICFLTVSFALYHLGVENHWWQAPRGCVVELPTLQALNKAAAIPNNIAYCDRVNWKIFGISSTLWSFVAAMFVFWISSISYVTDCLIRRIGDDD